MSPRGLRNAALTAAVVLGAASAQQPTPAPAPATTKPAELGAPAPLPAEAPPQLARIERQGLHQHAAWLADDARGGRHTTSAGQIATTKYIAEQWKKYGLKPLGDKGWFQHYPLERTWVDTGTTLTFGTTKVDRDFAVLATGETKVNVSGRFAWCGNGAPAAVPAGLAGRIPVVALYGASGSGAGNDLQAIQRYLDVAEQLGRQGATVGVVCLLQDDSSLGNTLNYRGLMPDHARLRYGNNARGRDQAWKIPLFVLSTAQSRQLLAFLGVPVDDKGHPTGPPGNDKAAGKLALGVKVDDKAVGTNVVGVLEGTTKKSEAVVFSAHHDHVGRRLDGDVFNGADDNASGTAGLLEIAEALGQGGARPARTIVFLSVSGEELGLWGSDWFAANPTWPLDKIVADINIDMIGRAGARDDGAILMQITPSHEHSEYSTMVRDAVALGRHFGITFSSGDTYYQRSDHFNFAKNGVPVVFFCDGEHPDYHQVTDTADRLHYDRMEAVARLACWTGWNVANGRTLPQKLGSQANW